MIEQIIPNLYRMQIPLPHSPLKATNSYLIKGNGRFLIVDTGFNLEESLHAMTTALSELKVDLDKTDFFVTHAHSDHLGLVAQLAVKTSKVYFNQPETDMLNRNASEGKLETTFEFFINNGFPEDVLRQSAASHPGRRFGMHQRVHFTIVKEDDAINIGDFSFRCISTPGHSPGHMCLYEPDEKIFLSGDHILGNITPNIAYWRELANPLKEYLANLDKVYPLDINLTLPGHRSLIPDHKKRIDELKKHHQERVKEVIVALETGAKTAYEITPYIRWNIRARSWEDFPVQQKWFAFGETLAHLVYMKEEGMVQENKEGNKILFSLA